MSIGFVRIKLRKSRSFRVYEAHCLTKKLNWVSGGGGSLKFLDFLNSILTKPMVTNLANVFYRDGISDFFVGNLLGENGYFIGF